MNQREKVYDLVAKIPEGKVLTYGLIARLAEIKNPRQVGSILHQNPFPDQVPCHRVVNAQGRLADNFAFGGLVGQSEKLQKEGVQVQEGKINLNTYLWLPSLP